MADAKRYTFVDRDHVRRYFNETIRAFYGVEPATDAVAIRLWAGAQRLFWYDSVDDAQGPDESPEAASARIAAHQARLDLVSSSDRCHVRLGLVKGNKPRRQKGVDVLLAVEMLSHAFKGSFDHAVLLAGDLDFKPVVGALVNTGTVVEVGYFAGHAARELLNAADSRREITFDVAHSWCAPAFRNANPLPNSYIPGSVNRPETILARGEAGGLPARLVQLENGTYEIVVEGYDRANNNRDLLVAHRDRELLVKYFPMRHGDLKLE